MSILKTLVVLALVGAGLLAAALTVGAFGQANPNTPIPIASDIEGLLTRTIRFLPEERFAFSRGFAYMGLTLVFTSLAALLVAQPKSETVPRPGRRLNRKEV